MTGSEAGEGREAAAEAGEPDEREAREEPGGSGLWWRLPGSVRLAIGIVAAGVLVAAALTLREPDVAFTAPERGPGEHVHDPAGVLDADAVARRLADLEEAAGVDVVAVAWEDERASLGQAARGAERLMAAWEADAALSAVAHPGAFSDQEVGRRFFGVEADRFEVGSDLRERIVEEAVPGPAAENDWTAAFLAAAAELEAELEQRS
jgi:hypothetical protein